MPGIGQMISHYRIAEKIGQGGMGEVYRALDTRLGREVALKILPSEFANDTGRRARFEQEARSAAALNHPNILNVYDVGTEGDILFIVTELIAGETLNILIQRGPVATRKLLEISVQIADGVAAAHASSIVHRDLKPSNIMISADGRVKILDFGLARQAKAAASVGSETLSFGATKPGMIVGTVNYMSPEQASGKMVDYRSDQFSFGLILYEMASGRKAFEKPESVQTMSAILTEEPPPIERSIPGPLRWIIDRCLAKDPTDRYESSSDLYRELRNLRDHISEISTTQIAAVEPHRRKYRIPVLTFMLGLIVMLAALIFSAPPLIPDQSDYRFTPFALDPGGQFGGVWSPNGKAFAYGGAVSGGQTQVFMRRLGSAVPVQLTHHPGGAYPRWWSPDSQRIYFTGATGAFSIAAVGGEPEPIASLTFPPSVFTLATAASPDGKAVAVLQWRDDHFRVWFRRSPDAPFEKYSPDPFASLNTFNQPAMQFTPDGKSILLFHASERKEEAWLMPYPPDLKSPPRLVLQDLPGYGGTPSFSWMPDSRHIILSTKFAPDEANQLWLADVLSTERHALTSGTAYRSMPAVSPDGHKIIFTETASNYDVVSALLDGSPPKELIATERNESMPAWAGRRPELVYVTDRNGPTEIWLRSGESDRPVVTTKDFPPGTAQWFMCPVLSPDADRLVYTCVGKSSGGRLWISSVSGGAPVALTNMTDAAEFPGSWSPDGNWFVYRAYRNGKLDLMKVKTTGQAAPIVLKADQNGSIPSWSPLGDWIACGQELISPDGKTTRSIGNKGSQYYMFSADGKLVYGIQTTGERNELFSVNIDTGAEKVLGDLGKAFTPSSYLVPGIRFSLAPDGKSFVYGISKSKSNLWMLEGFETRGNLLSRIAGRIFL
jgi:serine/threonine protein kinase